MLCERELHLDHNHNLICEPSTGLLSCYSFVDATRQKQHSTDLNLVNQHKIPLQLAIVACFAQV